MNKISIHALRACMYALFWFVATFGSTNAISAVVVSNDDWILSDTGFSQLPMDTANFALNVAQFLTGGSGSIHAYSNFFAFTGSGLANTLTDAGYSYTTGTSVTFDLPTLSTFDTLFLGIPLLTSTQLDVLTDYSNAGGNVYIHGGNGSSVPNAVPETWNQFLEPFGLSFETGFNGLNGNIPITSDHPLLDGVSALHIRAGHAITGSGVIATSPNGSGLIAVAPVPIPPAALLFVTSLVVLFGLARNKAD